MRIRERLALALDAVLVAYLQAGGVPADIVTGEALDVALAADRRVRTARRRMMKALERLRHAEDDAQAEFLAAEEACNEYAGRCAVAGFRAGSLLRGKLSGKSEE